MGSPLWPCCRMGLRNSVVCMSFPPHHPRIFPQDPLGSPPHPFCSVCCNFLAQHSAGSGSEEGFERRMEPLFSHSPVPVSQLLRAADGCSAGMEGSILVSNLLWTHCCENTIRNYGNTLCQGSPGKAASFGQQVNGWNQDQSPESAVSQACSHLAGRTSDRPPRMSS